MQTEEMTLTRAAKAEAIKAELRAVAVEYNGLLTAAAVVERAADPDNILHEQFTWDDTEAAREYRLWQARKLIAVVVTVVPCKDGSRTVDAYVSLLGDRNQDGGGYRAMADVLADKVLRRQLLAEALAELARMERKYKDLEELAAVFKVAREVKVS